MLPDQAVVHEALATISAAATRADWEAARDASLRAKAALDRLARDDPELPPDFWLEQDQQAVVVEAAITALDQARLDVASDLLELAPAGCDIEQPRDALRALRAGDPESTLAILLMSSAGGLLRQRIAEATAQVLDRGPWQHRILAVSAMGILAADAGSEDAYQAAKTRRTEWAQARNLHADSDLQGYMLVTMCRRRRGSPPSRIFDECAARYGDRMSELAPRIFDDVVAASRARLDAGQWSWSAFSIVATDDVRRGREAELNERVAAILAEVPDRARLISRILEGAREDPVFTRPPPRALVVAGPVASEVLGTFEVESPVLTVGDPGYANECLYLHHLLLGVRTGTWRAIVMRSPDEHSQCQLLLAHHVAHPCAFDEPIWIEEGSIDVEYATAGIFDCAHYYDEQLSSELPVLRAGEHPWFDLCIARAHDLPRAHDDRGAGVIPFGCVSSSGAGDGSYPCYAARDSDQVVIGVCIEFALSPHDE